MKTIFKYEVPMQGFSYLDLPHGAKVLSVGQQHDQMFIWVLVPDTGAIIKQRKFKVRGTGHPINPSENLEFIGTVTNFQGGLVFHLFEVIE